MCEKSNEYLVSIIIPVYRVEKYIERCANSLFAQTYSNIEYVFVNDCTPDRSMERLNEILKKNPARKVSVNVVENITNCGLAAVRNIGVKHCHGQFLMHVDSDDWLDVDVVEKCVKKQIETDADIIAFDRNIYLKDGIRKVSAREANTKEEFLVQMLRREREISIWGMLIRTSLYKEHQIACVEGINMSEDYQTSPRLVYYANRISILHGVAYNYECRNSKSISATFNKKNVNQEFVTLDVLSDFFENKEPIYQTAAEYGILKQLCYFRHNAAYYNLSRLFKKINSDLDKYQATRKKMLPLPYKIGLAIHSMRLLRCYVSILKCLKKYIGLIQ